MYSHHSLLKLNMREIKEACFLCLYADEVESSSHKENLSMFLTYLSAVESKVKTTFFGIVNVNGKTASQVMDVINNFLPKILNKIKYFLVLLMEIMQ